MRPWFTLLAFGWLAAAQTAGQEQLLREAGGAQLRGDDAAAIANAQAVVRTTQADM